MAYKRYAELINVSNQVSINSLAKRHDQNGDVTENGGELLDFYAYSPSSEEEMLQREELYEARLRVKRALMITKKYIQTVFNPIEIKFIKGLLTTNETPAKIAQTLGKKYGVLSKSIFDKFKATSSELEKAFNKIGYYFRSEIAFLPRLAEYVERQESNCRWVKENAERRKESKRQWYLKRYKKKTPEEIAAGIRARREAKLAKLSPEERERQIKKWAYFEEYYLKRKQANGKSSFSLLS